MKKKILYVLAGILVLICLLNSCTIVRSGCTGVKVDLGKVMDTPVPEGLNFKKPFITQVVQMDNRTKKLEVSGMAASSDLQNVSTGVTINYHLSPESSASIYKNVGKNYEDVIVAPAVPESVKAVTALYTAEELITKRQEVSDKIRDKLNEKLTPYGIVTESINITDFNFSEEFNAAIEAKQTAQQNALKAEQDLARIRVEAEQKIEQARAEAETYKLKSQQITDAMLKMEWINKWDGKLPTYMGSDNTMMQIPMGN